MRYFDPDLLRTLVTFAEVGTLARAAQIVGRTPSAVTAQMQRLEELAEVPLLQTNGRGRTLTPAGEQLVGHARRLLAAHREAWLSVAGTVADGHVSIGVLQDFAESGLPAILRGFARTHPRLRIDLRVGRSDDLDSMLAAGTIDVLVAMRGTVEPDEVAVFCEPMRWLTAEDGLVYSRGEELPLALLDAPCAFRASALHALEAAARPYRIAATSSGLAGVTTALRAGVAVTVRTSRQLGGGVALAPKELGLPALPQAEFSIRARPSAGDAARRLAHALVDGLRMAESVRGNR